MSLTGKKELSPSANYISHFRGLEILRFLLSLVVIIYHYQHFFYPFVPVSNNIIYHTKQPFYDLLGFFYNYGYYAVQVFWLISGVIFFKIYQEKIANGKTSFGSFILNRFSRLYPLHLVTLFMVLLLQVIYLKQHGEFFVYSNNSIKEFFQNLLFIQSWGQNKFSFNGPTWSVSIEILVYLVFFLIARSGFLTTTKSLILTLVFYIVLQKWQLVFLNRDLSTCFYFFFSGCLLICLYEKIRHNNLAIFLTIGGLTILLYIVLYPFGFLKTLLEKVTGYLDIHLLLIGVIAIISFLHFFANRFFDKINTRVFRFFGDMTYSTYLIHFPIQMILFLCINPSDYQVFFDMRFFLIYVFIVIISGRLTFIYFELPVQNWFRRKLNPKRLSNPL